MRVQIPAGRTKGENMKICSVCEKYMTDYGCGLWVCACGNSYKEYVICGNCGKREATTVWADGVLSWTHGFSKNWCEICCLEAQLAHALLPCAGLASITVQQTKCPKNLRDA